MVITVNSWNRVSDINEGKCSRKRFEEIISEHSINQYRPSTIPSVKLLLLCTSGYDPAIISTSYC